MDDHDLLLRLEGKVDALTSTLGSFIGSADKRYDDHESRLRENEMAIEALKTSSRVWRYSLSLAVAVGTIASTIIAALIASHRV